MELHLAFAGIPAQALSMGLPTAPVTFSAEQVADLNRKLSTMRHNVNNNLALMIAALELLRRKPEIAVKMADTISGQSNKLIEEVGTFSSEFEKAFGITRDSSSPFFEAPPSHEQ